MQKIKVITDSNSGFTPSEAEAAGVGLVATPFYVNGEEFFEETTLKSDKFWQLLEQGVDVKTSQPSPGQMTDAWDEALKTFDSVIYIPIGAALSATVETAARLAEPYCGRVQVVDNRRVSVTQKESIYEAMEMAKSGSSAEEIKQYLEKTGPISSIYIMVDDLQYLKKGGRIKPAAAAFGTLLGLKPVLYTRGEKFDKFAVAASVKQAKRKMLARIKEELSGEFAEYYERGVMTVSVAHTQNLAEAEKFKEEIMAEFPKCPFRFVDPLSLSVSCHIGPGALAIALALDEHLPKA